MDKVKLQQAKAWTEKELAVMAQVCKDPAAAALHPYALIGGVDPAIAVQAGVHAAVLVVHAVLQPEVDAALQLLFGPALCLL